MKRLIRSCRSLSASIDMSDLKVLPDKVEEYGGYTIREQDGKFSIWIDHEYYGDARNLDDAELIVDCLNDDAKVEASTRINRGRSRINRRGSACGR